MTFLPISLRIHPTNQNWHPVGRTQQPSTTIHQAVQRNEEGNIKITRKVHLLPQTHQAMDQIQDDVMNKKEKIRGGESYKCTNHLFFK